jgi:dTDP-4-dehydrorhamnose 3,5-epimerase
VIFIETKLPGAFLIEPEPVTDQRGSFARVYCREEFETRGLNSNVVQCSFSLNLKKGTLRGMHYQTKPFEEVKLVRCTRGSIYDVILDLRLESPTFKQWVAAELSAANHRMLYIPEGFAHGFLTLEDHSEVFYQMSEFYHPECAGGVRWDDPAFGIEWPEIGEPIVSLRDQQFADFKP